MKQRQSISAGVVFAGVVVLGLVVCIGWLVLSGRSDKSAPNVPPPQETITETQQRIDAKRFDGLNEAVDRFIQVYHYRDADTDEATLREQLGPLVTETFLADHMPSLSTDSDEWVFENDGVIEASAQIIPSDAAVSNKRASVTVDVTATGEANGIEEQPFTFTVVLDLVWQQKNWLVNDL